LSAVRGILTQDAKFSLCRGILIFPRNFTEFCRSWKFTSDYYNFWLDDVFLSWKESTPCLESQQLTL